MGAGASTQVQPKYRWDQDHVLRGPWTFLFKEKVQCACEGSRWCTKENPARQKQPNAIPGLHSSWVGDKVLAIARPWQSNVEQYGLVAAFQRENIGMILNLQEVGEHASCGPGNLPNTGFTYNPETFMAGGVGYYNFAWRDMGVPSLDRMMDIVQVMDFVTRMEGRKIVVHCHAGLGRTGLSIACFFTFANMYDDAAAAIEAVRRFRAGAVQTSGQTAFVTIFGQYLQHLRCLLQPQPGGSLRTQSAPPTSGGGALLPQEGLVESKQAGSALVGVYASGLTVTVPLQQQAAAASEPSGDTLTEAELGLQQPLPWNDAFQILPRHAKDFKPRPPRTYTEALARQARLLHGPERRAFLRLHKLVKEAVFTIIAAAEAFQPPARSRAASLPAIPEEGAGAAAGEITAAAAQPVLPPTFAHVLALLITHHSQSHVDSAALEPLAANAAYAAFTGPNVETYALRGTAASARDDLNRGRYEGLPGAPLLVTVMLLEAFFGNFAHGSEPSSLTAECLGIISRSYQDLFDGHVPPPPGTPRASNSGSAPPTPGSAPGSSNGSAPGSSDAAMEFARQAYGILEPLDPRDSELLLVFATLLRITARVSGPGCEEAVVEVGRWATGLLLGKLGSVAEAEEAVLSFLWYLAGRDEAFAMLVLLKRQRLAGVPRRTGPSGPVDVAAMLQAAAVSLTAPPVVGQVPLLAAATPPSVPGEASPSPQDAASADGSAQPSPAADYLDPNSPHMLPALQLAHLASQDIQQLYRVTFREAIAGISTVVYPPPMATGRIDVHDVWR